MNQLFQSSNLSQRNQLIQLFTPLLLTEIKQPSLSPLHQIEILKIFETLLTVVDASLRMTDDAISRHNQFSHTSFCFVGVRLASLIIPLFINFLPDASSTRSNTRLMSYIIERVQYLIPIYANEFRLILQSLPDLRTKLENAIRLQQQAKQQQQQQQKESNASSRNYLASLHSTAQAPSLPLRIDFSNFQSS